MLIISQNDPVTMIRCLTMVSGLIQGVKCDVAFDPTLSVLLEDLVSRRNFIRFSTLRSENFSRLRANKEHGIRSSTFEREVIISTSQYVSMQDNSA